MDQCMLEHGLWEGHGVDLRRVTLLDVEENGGKLIFGEGDDRWEASVVYFRAGYAPDDYASDKEWQARAVIEASNAIKCPTVAYQMGGTKKVQQALAAPGIIEKWLPSDAESLRGVFAGLYSLDVADGASVDAIVAEAIEHPSKFVCKPQREGGGNNLYGDELKESLTKFSPQERAAYVLMDRIQPPSKTATLVRGGESIVGACVCELSPIFEQSNISFFNLLLTSLCTWHAHAAAVDLDATCGGYFFKIFWKCRAQSPQGYRRAKRWM